MSPKKKRQLIMFNGVIVLINILLFSNAFLGFALFTGTALTISVAWMSILGSVFAFIRVNSLIFKKDETRLLTKGIQSLEDCISVFEEVIHNGDVFDENIQKNIEQIKRFRRKHETIKDILLQKFSADEMSFQKFNDVLHEVEKIIYLNVRSILNKISAFDIEEYEEMQRYEFKGDEFSQEKKDIYNEYIEFVNSATNTNEDILLKLDKMLLEISRYNSLEDGDIKKLPAIIEMDELIKNANLYK
ncbi:MAG TPA: hypothetical protein DEP72_01505 [Clostridiales bacterium]|nr:MAG: hypothetical protein A2Y18_05235 [Clostridiales bacterium GWD2_32_19]HCC06830.1 hypothetical protein [Clostridiales bacterium]